MLAWLSLVLGNLGGYLWLCTALGDKPLTWGIFLPVLSLQIIGLMFGFAKGSEL